MIKNFWGKFVSLAFRKKSHQMTESDRMIISALENLKLELDRVTTTLDNITDPCLIDSYIYQMKALHMKYAYYTRICKNRNLARS